MSFCMLRKPGEVADALDDVDEDDDVDETVEDDRGGRHTYFPRLMVKSEYPPTSSGGRSIMKLRSKQRIRQD